MKATIGDKIIADSPDVIECAGYQYFPRASVRMDWLRKTEKTDKDLECPHGVQFYDVVIDGERHPRAAWSYEAPQASRKQVDHWVGFWEDVEVR